MSNKSPFDPLPNIPKIPENCMTAKTFTELYSKDLTKFFTPNQTKPEYYEKYTKIIPIDRCFCYFQDLGMTLIKKDIAKGSAGSVSIVGYEDKEYIVKISKLKTTNAPTIDTEINYKLTEQDSLTFIGLHTFTEDTIISYIMNDLFRTKLNIASVIHQYGSSICPKFGIQLLEKANGGDLTSFPISHRTTLLKHGYLQQISEKVFMRHDLLEGILLQTLTAILYAKTHLNYLHNDLKADNVLISFTIDESTGKIKFQTKLADFGKASVKIGNTVLYNHKQKSLDNYEKYFDPSQTYIVPKTQLVTRFYTLNLYYTSFDIYFFFMSLLSNDVYFNTFFYLFDQNSIFFKCWEILFPSPDDASHVFKNLANVQSHIFKHRARVAIHQLYGITLRNDILPKLVNLLKQSRETAKPNNAKNSTKNSTSNKN